MVSFLQATPTKPCIHFPSPHTYATCHDHLIRLPLIALIIYCGKYKSWCFSLCNFLQTLAPITSSLLSSLFSTLFSQIPSAYVLPFMSETELNTRIKKQVKLLFVHFNLYIFWTADFSLTPKQWHSIEYLQIIALIISLKLYCPMRLYAALLKFTGKWLSMPYTGTASLHLLSSNLNVHTKSDKIRSSRHRSDFEICLLKAKYLAPYTTLRSYKGC